jgi:hypothetical protein
VGISLKIEINSPLTPDDKDMLAGIAVMTLAIANRELAAQGFPETFPPDDELESTELRPDAVDYIAGRTNEATTQAQAPCGAVSEDGMAVCVSGAGHRGRHRFRAIELVS